MKWQILIYRLTTLLAVVALLALNTPITMIAHAMPAHSDMNTTVADTGVEGEPGDSGATSAETVNTQNDMPPVVEAMAQKIMADLKGQGFEVLRGYFKLFTIDDCDRAYAVMGTCYGNNPAAPYVMPVLPLWPDEVDDPATKGAFGDDLEGYHTGYRFDPREAILILGNLPPKAAYFGFQTYLGNRQGYIHKEKDIYQWISSYAPFLLPTFFTLVPQNSERIQIAASLSNSINNVVLGNAWGEMRYIIVTPDQYMDRTIRDYYTSISISPSHVFSEAIPGDLVLGLNLEADDFVSLIRYSMPEDGGGEGTASYEWRHNTPLVVLRVRESNTTRQVEKFPAFTKPENRIGNSEKWLEPSLQNLVYAVSKRWNQACTSPDCSDKANTQEYTKFMDWQSNPIGLVGPLCKDNWMNCLGDTQDTVYQVSQPVTIDAGEIYAVMGPLGTETGNATYVGLGLNSNLKKKGFNNLDDDMLKDTANIFSEEVTNTQKLFVYYFTRNCAGLQAFTIGNCLQISEEEFAGCPDPNATTCEKLTFSLRDYIYPGTRRGPDSTQTLPPRVLKLHKVITTSTRKMYLPMTLK